VTPWLVVEKKKQALVRDLFFSLLFVRLSVALVSDLLSDLVRLLWMTSSFREIICYVGVGF
jgi:hypothetical protein